tara:strand:- start:382 stop:633 length:252 start_codon:yes stop_codon:yes gene_type:complete
MDFFQWFFVPFVTLMIILGGVWGIFQLQAKIRKSHSSDDHDQESVKEMLLALEKLEERIVSLESILNSEHPGWQNADDADLNN